MFGEYVLSFYLLVAFHQNLIYSSEHPANIESELVSKCHVMIPTTFSGCTYHLWGREIYRRQELRFKWNHSSLNWGRVTAYQWMDIDLLPSFLGPKKERIMLHFEINVNGLCNQRLSAISVKWQYRDSIRMTSFH